jgi:hypothetical protein
MMGFFLSVRLLVIGADCLRRATPFCLSAVLSVAVMLSGCSIAEHGAVRSEPPAVVTHPANFDAALRKNEAELAGRATAADLRLYNIGFILAHPGNPKRDPARALQSFRTLVAEHPRSAFAEQAKSWIIVLEEQQKLALERQKLLDEKRAIARQREILAQERQKLNYANEKSQQLDIEIEKRRRQSLGK